MKSGNPSDLSLIMNRIFSVNLQFICGHFSGNRAHIFGRSMDQNKRSRPPALKTL